MHFNETTTKKRRLGNMLNEKRLTGNRNENKCFFGLITTAD